MAFTREVRFKSFKVIGFKGKIEYILPEIPASECVGRLLKFSEISNVGEKRTYGLGVVKLKRLQFDLLRVT